MLTITGGTFNISVFFMINCKVSPPWRAHWILGVSLAVFGLAFLMFGTTVKLNKTFSVCCFVSFRVVSCLSVVIRVYFVRNRMPVYFWPCLFFKSAVIYSSRCAKLNEKSTRKVPCLFSKAFQIPMQNKD